MAVISNTDLDNARRNYVSDNSNNSLSKASLNAALQAIEDWFEANRPSLNTAINNSVSPSSLTSAQRRQLVREWVSIKFRFGG